MLPFLEPNFVHVQSNWRSWGPWSGALHYLVAPYHPLTASFPCIMGPSVLVHHYTHRCYLSKEHEYKIWQNVFLSQEIIKRCFEKHGSQDSLTSRRARAALDPLSPLSKHYHTHSQRKRSPLSLRLFYNRRQDITALHWVLIQATTLATFPSHGMLFSTHLVPRKLKFVLIAVSRNQKL